MVNSLYPAFVELDYITPFGAHTMTRPTLAWTGTPFVSIGTFATHAGGTIAANTMIAAFMAACLPVLTDDSAFVAYRIKTMASPTAPAILVWADSFTPIVGTSTAVGYAEAAQRTYSFYTTGAGQAKVVILDQPNNNSWGTVTSISGGADEDIETELTSNTNGWAGRDTQRPIAFKSLTHTLNEALRRAYRMI